MEPGSFPSFNAPSFACILFLLAIRMRNWNCKCFRGLNTLRHRYHHPFIPSSFSLAKSVPGDTYYFPLHFWEPCYLNSPSAAHKNPDSMTRRKMFLPCFLCWFLSCALEPEKPLSFSPCFILPLGARLHPVAPELIYPAI